MCRTSISARVKHFEMDRVVDDQVGFALGIQCKRFSLCPGQRTQVLYS